VTATFNPIQHGQEIDPLGASKKVQKGGAGGETQALMSFACIMGSARRKQSQEEGKIHPDLPGKKDVKGLSDTGNTTGRGGSPAIDAEEFPGEAKGKAHKPDQPLLVKAEGLAGGPHRGTLRGKAAEELGRLVNKPRGGREETVLAGGPYRGNLRGRAAEELGRLVNKPRGDRDDTALAGGPHRGTLRGKAAEEFRHFVTAASQGGEAVKVSNTLVASPRGTGMKRVGSSSGTIAVPSPKGVHWQTGVEKKVLTGAEPGSMNPESRKAGRQAGALKAETAAMAAAEDKIHSEKRGERGADPVRGQIRNAKGVAAPFRDAGITGGEAGEKFRAAEDPQEPVKTLVQKTIPAKGRVAVFQNEEKGAGKNSRAGEDISEPLDSILKGSAAVKGKIGGEKGGAERTSYTPPPGSGKDSIGSRPGLEDETAAVGHEKTGARKFRDHTAGVLHREPSRSGSVPERDLSVGGYQHTALHAGGKTAALSGNAGIPPRALIEQVASGAKMPGRVRIVLNPPSLGTLDVDVLVRDNKVHVILQTENSDVRQMLQSHMESLKGSLRSQGLVADSIQVFAQEKSNGDTYGYARSETLFGEGGNQGRNERGRGGGSVLPNHASPLPAEEAPRLRSDGGISVFA
jgi:hypothetical protein